MNSLGQSVFPEMAKDLFIAKVLAKDYVYMHVHSVQGLCLEACFAGRGGWPPQPERE